MSSLRFYELQCLQISSPSNLELSLDQLNLLVSLMNVSVSRGGAGKLTGVCNQANGALKKKDVEN
jgi:hypothetical protein